MRMIEVKISLKPLLETTSFDKFPILTKLLAALDEQEVDVELRPCEKGVEFRFLNEVKGMPNRAWLRIFSPAESKCLLFFHKKSSIPFSRDRFSYGGVVIDARSSHRFDEANVKEWIQFLLSGFHPGARPGSLKKSFPYTVPED